MIVDDDDDDDDVAAAATFSTGINGAIKFLNIITGVVELKWNTYWWESRRVRRTRLVC